MGDVGVAQRVVGRVSAPDRRRAIAVVCTIAIALVAWPVWTLAPVVNWDLDWAAALAYAAEHHMRFGDQVVFTYGPLGFLFTTPGPALFYDDITLLQWLVAMAVQLLLAGALLVALRRSFPLIVAVPAAALVLALATDRALALGFVLCALAVAQRGDVPRGRLAAAVPAALGALTGVLLLGKLNQGLELVALSVVVLVVAARRRDTLLYAVAAVAALALGWLGSGQAPADVWPYLRYGAEVVVGYAAAMGLEDPSRDWTYAAALLVAAAALALAWDAAREWEPRRRRGLLALFVVYLAFGFKEGFVRQDEVHMPEYFGDMLVLFAVVPVRRSRQAAAVAALVATAVAFGAVAGLGELGRSVNPYANVTAVADQVRTLASPSRRAAIEQELRGQVASRYGLEPQLMEAVGRRTVMLWPLMLTEVAYAYDLRLLPLPTLEPYSMYTPALDRLGARRLASERAPERIVRAANETESAVDHRHPTFEAPLVTLAILCRYRTIAEQAPWQVLARDANRCGAPSVVGTRGAAWGEPISVPAARRPDALVLARVRGAGEHGLERLRSLALRPRARWIALDGVRYRLVPSTAADGLLLEAPPEADFPAPFAMAPNPRTIAIGRDGGEPGGRLDVTFVEVPIHGAPIGANLG